MIQVTYVPPNEPGYPSFTDWNGLTFHANIPVDLDPANKKHGYMVPVVEQWIDPLTQQRRTKAVDKWVSMIDIARTNPHFRVGGETAPPAPRGVGRPRIPRTSGEYRGFAVAWITAAERFDDLRRWEEEETLRQRCQVGDDDIAYLRPFYDAKHAELKSQER